MASLQGWGRQTWNSGAWDTFAPVNATGNGLTSSVGTVSLVTTNVFGVTGLSITSNIGEASQASVYAATGNALTSTAGTMPNPTIVDNQLLTGWNRGVGTTVPLGWSTSSWGNGDFILSTANGLSGVGLTSSLGDETPTGNADVTATGNALTSTTGTAVATGIAEVTATGNALTSALGTEVATGDSNVTATGNALTSSLGEEDASGVFQSGWGRGANQVTGQIIGWSDNLWNILETEYALTGVSATSSPGDLGFQGDVAPTITGVELTSAATTPGTSVFVTGVSATSSIGTFSISGDNNTTIVVTEQGLVSRAGTLPITIDVAPQTLTPSLGSLTLTGDANVTLTGNGTTVSLGDEEASGSAPVDVTGNLITNDLGDPVVTAGATVSVTAAGLTSSIGDATQETSYEAPSVALTSNVGTVNIRTDVVFTITGNSVTSSVGNLQGTFWSQVDDSNSGISWTEVHKAA
jgi:hypothetical protein